MLIPKRYGDAIAAGELTLVFRRWARSRVIAGRRYRTAAGIVEVESVDIVEPSGLTEIDATDAGFGSLSDLLDDLRGPEDQPLHRIQIHAVTDPDPREVLAATDQLSDDGVTEIDRRLARLDRASSYGAWTAETLDLIRRHPGVRAADLAAMVGREKPPFKLDVRKLKNLGLTHSLEVGYRLSPRGMAYLAAKIDHPGR